MKPVTKISLLLLSTLLFCSYAIAQPPDWSVNPHDFEFNLTVTAIVTINESESFDSNNIVAAFVEDECRGKASPIETLDRQMYFLMVYSNTNNETIKFKVYDAAMDMVLDCTDQISFVSGNGLGTVDEPFTIPAVNHYSILDAVSDNVNTDEGVTTTIAILDNDAYSPEVQISLSIFDEPLHGDATLTDENAISYTPDLNFFGKDSLTYILSNSNLSDTASVIININHVAITPEPGYVSDFTLDQNFPNPFNPSTNIGYGIPHDLFVELTIYTLSGREVRKLISQKQSKGKGYVYWNGKDDAGNSVPAGIYLCRMTAQGYTNIIKMVLLK